MRFAAPRPLQRCPCRVPTSQTGVPILCRQTLRCPAFRCRPASFLPVASGVAGRCRARDALSRSRAVPDGAFRAPLAPVLRIAAMRPVLLRCAAMSNDARAGSQIASRFPHSLPAIASLPGRPQWPHVSVAVASGVAGRSRARDARSCRARCHIARFARAMLRSCGFRRCGPHSCGAPRCPTMPATRAQLANRCPYALPAKKRFFAPPPPVAPRLSRPSPAASRGAAARTAV